MFNLKHGINCIYSQELLSQCDSTDHFWTSSQWSPDGMALAATDNNRHVYTWLLPQDTFTRNAEAFAKVSASPGADLTPQAGPKPCVPPQLPQAQSVVREAEFVDAQVWHPSSCVSNPAWCVFATASKDQPVHLWDALSGQVSALFAPCAPLWPRHVHHLLSAQIRASFSLRKQEEFIVGASSLAFDFGRPWLYAAREGVVSCCGRRCAHRSGS